MKNKKMLPELFLPKDLLTEKDLNDIADRVINKKEMLGDIVFDYKCHIYTLNRYLTISDDIRIRFNTFIREVRKSTSNKEKFELSEEDIQNLKIIDDIVDINLKARDADNTVMLLNKMKSREVAKELGMSKTKMYDTLNIMGFKYNQALKQWVHVDANDIPKNLEGLNRDLELIDLYVSRYGDFELYNSDSIIKVMDAEIVEDVRLLAEELNYETDDDLINVLILRGLQSIDYRKVEVNRDNYNPIDFTEEEYWDFLKKGANNCLEEYKQELIKNYSINKKKVNNMTDEQIFMLYRSKTNN